MKTEKLKSIVLPAIKQVFDYRNGNGKFNLSHIQDQHERTNAALDLWYEVESDLREAKIVVEDICASGGYYVAVAADQILVDKASLVGSIGVIMEGFGFTGLMDKLGVTRRMITAGSNKGMLDPFSKEDPKQVEMVRTMIDEIHQQFIRVVKEGRGDRLKEAPELFSGRVWNGEQAVKLGLADGYGTVDSVARDVFKAPEVLDYTMKENFAERVAKRFGAEVGAAAGKALVKSPDLK